MMSVMGSVLRNAMIARERTGSQLNPILALGLSENILDLGLPDAELYKYVRRFAKSMAQALHPDVNARTRPKTNEFLEAMQVLSSEQRFYTALRELKTDHSRTKTDYNLAVQQNEATKQRLDSAEITIRNLLEQKSAWQTEAARKKLLEVLWLKALNVVCADSKKIIHACTIGSCSHIDTLMFDVLQGKYKPIGEITPEIERRYHALQDMPKSGAVEALRADLLDAIKKTGRLNRTPSALVKEALRIKNAFPSVHWYEKKALMALGFKRYGDGTRALHSEPASMKSKDDSEYRKALLEVADMLEDSGVEYVAEMRVKAQGYNLTAGSTLKRTTQRNPEIIIGSLPLEKVPNNFSGQLSLNDSSLLEKHLIPMVVKGKLLVTATIRSVNWSLASSGYELSQNLQKFMRDDKKFILHCHHYVLNIT